MAGWTITPWAVSWIGGLTLIALTIAMHAVGLVALARLLRSLRHNVLPVRLRLHASAAFASVVIGLAGATLAALHAAEAAIWAGAFILLGAMDKPSDAILYSVDSMTTRGASGLQLAQEWRMMGALEAANGMLLFGISTAFLFAVLQHVWPMVLGTAPAEPEAE